MSTMIHIHNVGLFFNHPGPKNGKKTFYFLEKKSYDNKKRYPKFGMATYTKEIITIKQR